MEIAGAPTCPSSNYSFATEDSDYPDNTDQMDVDPVVTSCGFRLPKKELVRCLQQALNDMGYCNASRALEEESKVPLHNGNVKILNRAVMEGDWDIVNQTMGILLGGQPG